MKTLNTISKIFHTEPNVSGKLLFSRTKVKKKLKLQYFKNYLTALITVTDDFMIFMY